MAFAILAEIPELTQEQYDQVVKKVNESGPPAGALVHAGGPMDGGFRVIEVWQTREAADAFYGSDLYREATAPVATEPHVVMTWPVHGLDVGNGWRPVD